MKPAHDYAKFFPPMAAEDFSALCEDVKANGLHNPIILFEGKVLDGINRQRACAETGVKPVYEEFKNGKVDAFEYVVSQNILRRHLTTSQRAVLALELEKKIAAVPASKRGPAPFVAASVGKSQGTKNKDNSPAGRAAAAVHVRPDIVQQAKRLAKEAPHMLNDVRAGKITVREALISNLDRRAHERAIKEKNDTTRDRLQKEDRQVAEFFDAVKSFKVALKVAMGDRERFSKEAIRFTSTRMDDIRNLMSEFEAALKSGG